jgi:acetyltransferase-like isoleucine patch superfamily enzyme
VIVLDGVNIGDGSVIGAGAVVTKSTEPYGVYVGNPARKVKQRMSIYSDSDEC